MWGVIELLLVLQIARWCENRRRKRKGLPEFSTKRFLQDLGLWP